MDTVAKADGRSKSLATVALAAFAVVLTAAPGNASGATALGPGSPHPVSGPWHGKRHFYIDVPHNAKRLVVRLWGGTGNAHIFAKRNCPPVGVWTYKSTHPGNNEHIHVGNPQHGRWFIMVHAHSTYHHAHLVAEYEVNHPPAWQHAATEVAPVILEHAMRRAAERDDDHDDDDDDNRAEDSERSERSDRSDRPVASRTVTLRSGQWLGDLSGDCRLFVRRNALPTLHEFDHGSTAGGTRKTMNFDENVRAGTCYIMLHSKTGYRGVSLVAKATPEE